MARHHEVPETDFDIQRFMPPVNLPPLVVQEELKPAPEAAPQPVPQASAPQSAPTADQSLPRLKPIVPASFDAVHAWRQNEQMRQEIARPRPALPSQTLMAAPGLFASPLLPPAPERLALAAAPVPEILRSPEGKAKPGRKDAPEDPNTSKESGDNKPPHLIELVTTHKLASIGVIAGMALLAVVGAKTSGDTLPDLSANSAAASQQYPDIRNEAINCDSPAVTMAFTSNANASIPVTLKEAGHTNSYLEFDVKGFASSVAKICGIRKNQAGQTLATFNKKANDYIFDRSHVQLVANESSFNASAISIALTAAYVDGKSLTADQVGKYPYDAKTTKLLQTLIMTDPKTKAVVAKPELQRYVWVKMEKEGLAALQDPKQCGNTQDAVDQAVNNYISSQLARKTPAAIKTSTTSAVGKNQYGDMVSSFMSDKGTASYANSGVVKLSNFTLRSCDATLPKQAAAPKPSVTKKG